MDCGIRHFQPQPIRGGTHLRAASQTEILGVGAPSLYAGDSQSIAGTKYVLSVSIMLVMADFRRLTQALVCASKQMMVLNRIKYQLGYPEAAKDMLKPKSLLTAVEQYSMGTERPLEEYLRIVGLNMTTKLVHMTGWCESGKPPPGFEEYNSMYT